MDHQCCLAIIPLCWTACSHTHKGSPSCSGSVGEDWRNPEDRLQKHAQLQRCSGLNIRTLRPYRDPLYFFAFSATLIPIKVQTQAGTTDFHSYILVL